MRFKLDENLGRHALQLFRDAGYDAATVHEQRLGSTPDPELIEICRAEARCLVTLDIDFANPFVYDPGEYSGIAVLRLPGNPAMPVLNEVVRTLLLHLSANDVNRKLWIIEPGRIREYQDETTAAE